MQVQKVPLRDKLHQAVVAYAFNPSTWESRGRPISVLCELEASLVYKSKFQDRHQSYKETLSGGLGEPISALFSQCSSENAG